MADNYSVKYIFEAIDRMTNNLDDIKKNLRGMDNQFEDTAKRAKTLSQKMESAGRSIRNFGNKMRYVSLVATGLGVAGVVAFGKMEEGLANVHGLLSSDQIKKYSKDLETLQREGIAAGFSIEDTNKALFDTISALGLSENSMDAYRQAIILAEGGNASLGSSVLGLAKIMNVYGRETTSAKEVANALFSAQKVGTTTVEELAQNVGKISGMAKLAGMSFQEMLSPFAVLTNTLENSEEASTAMVAILKAITNPAKEAGNKLKQLGISTGITAVKNVGFATVLKQVRNAMIKYPDYLAQAIPETRALKGLTALTAESLKLMDDTVVQMSKDVKEGTGLMESYKKSQEILSDAIDDTKGSLTLMGAEIGEVLAPYVKLLAEKIKYLSDWMISLDPSVKKMIVVFGSLAAIIAPLALAIGSMIALFAFIGTAAGGVIAAISGIMFAVGALIVYWEDFVNLMKTVWYWITKIGSYLTYGLSLGAIDTINNYKGWMPKFGNQEEIKNNVVKEELLLNSNNMSQANVNVNLNAPKGTVKNYSSETVGSGMKLGVNMGGL